MHPVIVDVRGISIALELSCRRDESFSATIEARLPAISYKDTGI